MSFWGCRARAVEFDCIRAQNSLISCLICLIEDISIAVGIDILVKHFNLVNDLDLKYLQIESDNVHCVNRQFQMNYLNIFN